MTRVKEWLHRAGHVRVEWACGSTLLVSGFEAWWVVSILFVVGFVLGGLIL